MTLPTSQGTDHARAVWLLWVLAKKVQRRPDGSGVLVLSARAVAAISTYSSEAQSAGEAA